VKSSLYVFYKKEAPSSSSSAVMIRKAKVAVSSISARRLIVGMPAAEILLNSTTGR